MPRLGATYDIEIEVISKPKADYLTDDYFALDLPVASAVMVENEILIEGKDIDDPRSRWPSAAGSACRNPGLNRKKRVLWPDSSANNHFRNRMLS